MPQWRRAVLSFLDGKLTTHYLDLMAAMSLANPVVMQVEEWLKTPKFKN